MEKRLEVEGSAGSQFVQLMRKYGKNRDLTIDVATVKETSPLVVQLDADGLILDRADMILTATVASLTLIPGEKVVVIGDDDTQLYFIIDKAVV